ncbi:hypothetical protein ILYODFUR_036989 [Ilyodon furcidens]|uniref:Uncharacterized protein n=1 Tax=Ilyodon furcidens TaxID=33524 RepID=A0ABV0TTP6_9TELE
MSSTADAWQSRSCRIEDVPSPGHNKSVTDCGKKRDAVICCLIEYLGEKQEEVFQDCQGEHEDHTDQTMKVLVIHNPLAEKDPAEVSVVIEGNRVLNGCGNRTKACMLLMGLIYSLNLEYPKMFKNAFAVFQKDFLELDGAKLPRKGHSLKGNLMKCT